MPDAICDTRVHVGFVRNVSCLFGKNGFLQIPISVDDAEYPARRKDIVYRSAFVKDMIISSMSSGYIGEIVLNFDCS